MTTRLSGCISNALWKGDCNRRKTQKNTQKMYVENADNEWIILFTNNLLSTLLHLSLLFALSSLLLFWFFSRFGLLCRPPRQDVVGDQSCEEVRCHAGVAPEHQAQRLHQHKQQKDVNGRPVVQLHAILLRGAHHSKKIDERHRRVEGQLHHEAEGRGTCTHWKAWERGKLSESLAEALSYLLLSHTHQDLSSGASQIEEWRSIWQGNIRGLLIRHHGCLVKHYPRRRPPTLRYGWKPSPHQKEVNTKAEKGDFFSSPEVPEEVSLININ